MENLIFMFITLLDWTSVKNMDNRHAISWPVVKNDKTCATVNIKVGAEYVKTSMIPRGYCSYCCPVDINRDIRFVLYNKNNPADGTAISIEEGSAQKSGVNPEWSTVIYVHGFLEVSPGNSGQGIKDAYLSRPENINIILLDYTELSSFPWYWTAVKNVKIVTTILSNFLKLFHKSGEIPINTVHVIGFSLGAHIAGLAGRNLRNNRLRVPRITALDAAFPEFPVKDVSKRITKSDAIYVDAIHTDGGFFGYPIAIGHADFFVNGGGPFQPGCDPRYLSHHKTNDALWSCSHPRSWKIYAESIGNPDAFPATRCEQWFGDNATCSFTVDAFLGFKNRNARGQFYLATDSKSPYGLNKQEQIKYGYRNVRLLL